MKSSQLQELEEMEAQLCARIAGMVEEQRSSCSVRQLFPERPRIGVFAARGILRDGAWRSYAGDQLTIDAIGESGGYPLELPTYPIAPGLDMFDVLADYGTFKGIFDAIWPVVRDLDGLVFTGGGDLDSRFFYRKVPHPRLQTPDMWRDTHEWFSGLIGWVLFKTTLGICRGAQLMNVLLRGELIQDHEELDRLWRVRMRMTRGMPPLEAHRKGRPIYKNFTCHPLHIVQRSWLAQAVRGRGEHAAQRYFIDEVVTQHHNFIAVVQPHPLQVIHGDLATGLEVVGYSPDGVVEATASKDPRRIYGAVQFHPEATRSLAWSSSLFSYIVEGAARDLAIQRTFYETFREDVLAWLWQCASTLHELQGEERARLASADAHSNESRTTDVLQGQDIPTEAARA